MFPIILNGESMVRINFNKEIEIELINNKKNILWSITKQLNKDDISYFEEDDILDIDNIINGKWFNTIDLGLLELVDISRNYEILSFELHKWSKNNIDYKDLKRITIYHLQNKIYLILNDKIYIGWKY